MDSQALIKILSDLSVDTTSFASDTPLLGAESQIDSMTLVQLCIQLEDQSRADGFIFDWTSEKAMSRLNSMFRTITSLVEEYNCQLSAAEEINQ